MTISLEKIFFGYILENKKYFQIVLPQFFKNNEIKFVYDVIRKYVTSKQNIEIPTPRQLWEMVNLEDENGLISREVFKSMLTINLKEYSEDNFIVPKINSWILANRIKLGTSDIIDETRDLDNLSDFESVVESANKIKTIVDDMSNTSFLKDEEDLGSDFDEPEHHVQDSSKFKIKSGFDTLDHILGGGWDIQTLNILMAETNNGKCILDESKILVRSNENKSNEYLMNISSLFNKISKL